jgi:hypothetical protein
MKTTDDRGRTVTLLKFERGTSTTGGRAPLKYSPNQLNRQRKHEASNVLFLFAMLIPVSVGLVMATTTLPLRGHYYIRGALVLSCAAAMIAAFRFVVRRADRIHAIHHMPAMGLCPACGYGIRGVPSEADGCTVCPECGAAWRVPPNPASQTSAPST